MNETVQEWEIGRRAWCLFPRSAAILAFVTLTVIYGSIERADDAYTVFAIIWLGLNIVRVVMRDPYKRNIWYMIGFPVKTISAWPILWGSVAILVVIGVLRGLSPVFLVLVILLYVISGVVEAIFFR